MAYNHINRLTLYHKIAEITQKNFVPDVTPYSEIWRKYINPTYPISYKTYIKIINTDIKGGLRDECERLGRDHSLVGKDKNQLKLF